MVCKAANWGTLPGAGGWYDQKAGLMDKFLKIMAAEAEEEERKERQKKSNHGGPRGKDYMKSKY